MYPPGFVAPWLPGLGSPQASLAAALRDGGIIAELGYAKEERITNERNKSYPDKAVAAVLSGVSVQASPTTNSPPKAGAAADGNIGARFEVESEVKPATGGEQDQFRVGCIVDIPASPHIPPMRIGEHPFTILLLLVVSTHRVLTKIELCRAVLWCFVLFQSVHIDHKSAAAVLLDTTIIGLDEPQPTDPHALLARHARLRPLSVLRYRSNQPVATAHG